MMAFYSISSAGPLPVSPALSAHPPWRTTNHRPRRSTHHSPTAQWPTPPLHPCPTSTHPHPRPSNPDPWSTRLSRRATSLPSVHRGTDISMVRDDPCRGIGDRIMSTLNASPRSLGKRLRKSRRRPRCGWSCITRKRWRESWGGRKGMWPGLCQRRDKSVDCAITIYRRTTLEKQLAADHETPDHMKHRQLQALGRRESK